MTTELRGDDAAEVNDATTSDLHDVAVGRPASAPRWMSAVLTGMRLGPVIILIVLIVVLSLTADSFMSFENAGNVLKQSAVISVLALGQLLVVVTRGIDLSVGSNLSLSAVVGGLVWRDTGSSVLSVGAMLATGATVGLVNGLLFVKGRLPHPFIPTLAMLTAASGLALYLAKSKTIQGAPPLVKTLGSGRISWIPGGGPLGWFPVATVVVVAVALLLILITRALVWGRWVYSVGGNQEAAVRNGISVGWVLISVYVLCGLLAGVAAVLTMGKGHAASPTSGQLAELDAIAAVIIGGASFLGGRGSVTNALTGAMVIAVLRNGLNLLGIDPNWQYIATGVVIVLAVELDVVRGYVERRFRSMQAALS